MNAKSMFRLLVPGLLVAAALTGCSDSTEPHGSASFTVTVANVSTPKDFLVSGVFNTPVGETMPGPIGPGQAYEFRIGAAPGDRLSFATMFAQSNDVFFAPDGDGIALYGAKAAPIDGDVTSQVMLWDAGTEMNEEPGIGMNQAPRQSAPNTGPADSDDTVRLVDDGYTYPAVSDVIKVMVTSEGGGEFTVRIENVSTSMTLEAGDIIATGTPAGVGIGFDPPKFLRHGDVVRVAISGIGEIENALVVAPA